jgi:DNA-binding response OmpR family regulator
MFHLKEWLQFARGRPQHGDAAPAPGEPPIAVLLITRDATAGTQLAGIAAQAGWQALVAPSVAAAVTMLSRQGSAVVVLDRDLPGEDWRHHLPHLALLPQSAAVLLASTVADEYLWQEVSHHHGQDILRKPLARQEVVRAVENAWSFRRLRGS